MTDRKGRLRGGYEFLFQKGEKGDLPEPDEVTVEYMAEAVTAELAVITELLEENLRHRPDRTVQRDIGRVAWIMDYFEGKDEQELRDALRKLKTGGRLTHSDPLDTLALHFLRLMEEESKLGPVRKTVTDLEKEALFTTDLLPKEGYGLDDTIFDIVEANESQRATMGQLRLFLRLVRAPKGASQQAIQSAMYTAAGTLRQVADSVAMKNGDNAHLRKGAGLIYRMLRPECIQDLHANPVQVAIVCNKTSNQNNLSDEQARHDTEAHIAYALRSYFGVEV